MTAKTKLLALRIVTAVLFVLLIFSVVPIESKYTFLIALVTTMFAGISMTNPGMAERRLSYRQDVIRALVISIAFVGITLGFGIGKYPPLTAGLGILSSASVVALRWYDRRLGENSAGINDERGAP